MKVSPFSQVRTIAAARVAGVAAVNPSKVCRLGFRAVARLIILRIVGF